MQTTKRCAQVRNSPHPADRINHITRSRDATSKLTKNGEVNGNLKSSTPDFLNSDVPHSCKMNLRQYVVMCTHTCVFNTYEIMKKDLIIGLISFDHLSSNKNSSAIRRILCVLGYINHVIPMGTVCSHRRHRCGPYVVRKHRFRNLNDDVIQTHDVFQSMISDEELYRVGRPVGRSPRNMKSSLS